MAEQRFDAVVIGAGQGGTPLALALAGAGRRTALIECDQVGGTCVNTGCTPTKTMVASARVAHLARRAADYGVDCGPVRVALDRVRARKRAMVETFRTGSQRRLDETEGLELIRGQARFAGPRQIEVALNGGGSRRLAAEWVIIDTGSRPRRPALPGLDSVAALDSTSIMELDRVPEHLIVIGGGYIGLEFGQMFLRFGSRVTLIQRGRQLLAREDEDVAEMIHDIMIEDGMEVLLESRPLRCAPDGRGVVLEVERPRGTERIAGSHLLLAAGRSPNSDALNLAAAGVETDARGHIQVDDRLATSAPGVWALGDVIGGPAFTHVSFDQHRILRANLLDGEQLEYVDRQVPYTVFIDPQLGRIGDTEVQALAYGHSIRVTTMSMEWVARALEADETRGMLKAVVDADTDRILGFAALGIAGGELMAAVQVAMLADLPYTALRDAVFAHPTLAEALNNLFADLV